MKKYISFALIGAVVLLGVFFFLPTEPSTDTEDSDTPAPVKEAQNSSRDFLILYFYSSLYERETGTYAIACPQTKDIDWRLAIYALSKYMQEQEDLGPAEIQRNFDANCERNMRIYRDLSPHIRIKGGAR